MAPLAKKNIYFSLLCPVKKYIFFLYSAYKKVSYLSYYPTTCR